MGYFQYPRYLIYLLYLQEIMKNHNTVAVGGHPNPTQLHCPAILPAAGSLIIWLSRRNSQQGGTDKCTRGGGRRNAQQGGENAQFWCTNTQDTQKEVHI